MSEQGFENKEQFADLSGQIMTFSCNDEVYAFDIKDITDIMEVPEITPVPKLPEFLLGVMNLRGQVVPVMDFNLRMGKPRQEYDMKTCVIVTERDKANIGIIVNRVIDVELVTAKDIIPYPQKNSVIRGIIERNGVRESLIDWYALVEIERNN
ncbi:MAG: chemotaxis protein CheW [Ruminococcus sp.]|nr:chemotaxis protein CheW [Ruminococcus sp.]